MSGFVKKAVVWLGLNEEYPADDRAIVEPPRPDRPERPVGPDRQAPRPAAPSPQPQMQGRERPQPQAGPAASRPADSAVRAVPLETETTNPTSDQTVRVLPMDAPSPKSGSDLGIGTVRPVTMPATTKPQLIIPKSFNDAQAVADAFKDQTPVIVNMQSAERDLARRLIDFSSGLCYGLGGQMERVAESVYLLTPTDVEVDDAERHRYS